MADSKKCGHDMCRCSAQADSDYCSDHCKNTVESDMTEIKCDCGHDHCEA